MKTLLIFALILSAPLASAAVPGCKDKLQGFTVWDDEGPKGEILLKHTVFPLGDWSPDGNQFDSVILTDTVPAGKLTLEMEFIPGKGGTHVTKAYSRLLPFSREPKLRQFDDFVGQEFFSSFKEAGSYVVRLKSGDKLLCQEKHAFAVGD
jgi:hypothetical protein